MLRGVFALVVRLLAEPRIPLQNLYHEVRPPLSCPWRDLTAGVAEVPITSRPSRSYIGQSGSARRPDVRPID